MANPGLDVVFVGPRKKTKEKEGLSKRAISVVCVEDAHRTAPNWSRRHTGWNHPHFRHRNRQVDQFVQGQSHLRELHCIFCRKENGWQWAAGRPEGDGEDECAIRLFQMPKGSEGPILKGHTSGVTSVAFSDDEKYLISASHDKTARIWRLDTDELLQTLDGFPGGVSSAKFAPTGKRAATACNDVITIWDPVKPEKLRSVSLDTEKKRVHRTCYSPDGLVLAIADADSYARLLDVESGKVRAILKGHEKGVWFVVFSPDGKTLFTGGSDGLLKLWDVSAFSGPGAK